MGLITPAKPVSIEGYREAAAKKIPDHLMTYVEGGSASEETLKENTAAWKKHEIRQRAFGLDTKDPDTSVKLLGEDFSVPLVLGPIGSAGMLYPPHGEIEAARAAKNAKVPFTLSTMSVCSVEDVVGNVETPPWFQIYMHRNRNFTKQLLQRAEQQGCKTLMWTVDRPVGGERHFEDMPGGARECFSGSAGGAWRLAQQLALRPAWTWAAKGYLNKWGRPKNVFGNIKPAVGEQATLVEARAWLGKNVDVRFVKEDLDFVRDNWNGKLIVKGIMDVQDAKMLVDKEVDGVVISNHGGRQQDGAPSTASALPHIKSVVKETNSDITILVDGGIYNAQNAFRALALGADGILWGRVWSWALAARGQQGVEHVVELLKNGLQQTMAMAGVSSIEQINEDCLNPYKNAIASKIDIQP